jgi:hypothetical protein
MTFVDSKNHSRDMTVDSGQFTGGTQTTGPRTIGN